MFASGGSILYAKPTDQNREINHHILSHSHVTVYKEHAEPSKLDQFLKAKCYTLMSGWVQNTAKLTYSRSHRGELIQS